MEKYKVTLSRFGRAYVLADTKEQAFWAAQNLVEDDIKWFSREDGLPGKYLVTLV